MTEEEYIKVTNLQKMRTVVPLLDDMMGDVNSGHDYGITDVELKNIRELAYNLREKLFESFELDS